MLDYAKDPVATALAYVSGLLADKKRRSYIDNLGHLHLRGRDVGRQRNVLFHKRFGLCEDCGRYRDENHGDMNHKGKTPKTRCECFEQRLNDGTICTGIEWLCTLDPRKGGSPKSCHGRKHPQVQFSAASKERGVGANGA